MARSSIQGTSPVPTEPAGRDAASLGPSDSSDSGSDMMGIDDSEGGDPNAPTDVAARDDHNTEPRTPEALDSPSDAAGTGESRSAGADGGKRDGWDIGVDRVIAAPDGPEVDDEDEDPDLAFVDEAEAGSDDAASDDDEEGAEGDDPARPKR